MPLWARGTYGSGNPGDAAIRIARAKEDQDEQDRRRRAREAARLRRMQQERREHGLAEPFASPRLAWCIAEEAIADGFDGFLDASVHVNRRLQRELEQQELERMELEQRERMRDLRVSGRTGGEQQQWELPRAVNWQKLQQAFRQQQQTGTKAVVEWFGAVASLFANEGKGTAVDEEHKEASQKREMRRREEQERKRREEEERKDEQRRKKREEEWRKEEQKKKKQEEEWRKEEQKRKKQEEEWRKEEQKRKKREEEWRKEEQKRKKQEEEWRQEELERKKWQEEREREEREWKQWKEKQEKEEYEWLQRQEERQSQQFLGSALMREPRASYAGARDPLSSVAQGRPIRNPRLDDQQVHYHQPSDFTHYHHAS